RSPGADGFKAERSADRCTTARTDGLVTCMRGISTADRLVLVVQAFRPAVIVREIARQTCRSRKHAARRGKTRRRRHRLLPAARAEVGPSRGGRLRVVGVDGCTGGLAGPRLLLW